jgi:hypothetical protein
MRRCSLIAALMIVLAPSQARALSITPNFLGGTASSNTTGTGDLETIFRSAAAAWETAFPEDHTVVLDFGWAALTESSAQHTLLSQGGDPNRETAGSILFANNNALLAWYLDPTPLSNEEFSTYSETTQDFGAGAMITGRYYTAPVNGPLGLDLYSAALHEIGHALGMSLGNSRFIADAADGDLDITSPLPFAGSSIPLATNNFGVTSHLGPFLGYGAVMIGLNDSERRLPSEMDIVALGQLSGYTRVNLNPTAPVPEPSTILLLGTGIVGLISTRRRKRTS